ncbi:hypothetical protein CY35_08G141100 [Sphagnum magellanicum]|nr:hypothetical protein CY35_08G141100 [Sphagnum magellanicum]KAH9555910.1 hypothetical protein CY35_08G141100 [Sphagnum magellanicum]
MDNEKLVVEVELNGEINVEDTSTAVVPFESNGLLKVDGISTTDVEDVAEGIRAIAVYNEWVSPTVTGQRPLARYQHAVGVVDNKMYIIGGNHSGRYLNDVQVLDLKTLEWSKVDKVPQSPLSLQQKQSPYWFPPCAGHSLVRWGTKLLAVAGRSKEPVDIVIGVATASGCTLIARHGQSVTLVGSTLVMFGGEVSHRHLMDDLNILDLESLTWEAIETRFEAGQDHLHVQTMLQQFMETVIFSYLVVAHILIATMTYMCLTLRIWSGHKHRLKALYRHHMLGMLVPLLVTIFILLVVEIIRVAFLIP